MTFEVIPYFMEICYRILSNRLINEYSGNSLAKIPYPHHQGSPVFFVKCKRTYVPIIRFIFFPTLLIYCLLNPISSYYI